jgi:hypothetical protein
MKAQKADDETKASANAIAKCGGTLAEKIEISLSSPEGAIEPRTIVVIAKNKQTPSEFPRHYSKIAKKPL